MINIMENFLFQYMKRGLSNDIKEKRVAMKCLCECHSIFNLSPNSQSLHCLDCQLTKGDIP